MENFHINENININENNRYNMNSSFEDDKKEINTKASPNITSILSCNPNLLILSIANWYLTSSFSIVVTYTSGLDDAISIVEYPIGHDSTEHHDQTVNQEDTPIWQWVLSKIPI